MRYLGGVRPAGLAAAGRIPVPAAGHTRPMASWWYCLVHGQVEVETGCALTDRLGPYASKEEAEQALATARQRTAEQDARDRADDDWGTPPAKG